MENATKALMIAAGVFLAMMILTLGVYLYGALNSYVTENKETMEANALSRFNTQFLNYINYQDNGQEVFELHIQDVVTAANLAYNNNMNYGFDMTEDYDDTTLYVTVNIIDAENDNIVHLERNINNISSSLLSKNIGKKYKCRTNDIKISPTTGRVCEITFREI